MEGKNREGEGTTPVTMAFPEARMFMCKKLEKTIETKNKENICETDVRTLFDLSCIREEGFSI